MAHETAGSLDIVCRIGGLSYFDHVRQLMGAQTQGSFAEGWSFFPRYVIEVERLSAIAWTDAPSHHRLQNLLPTSDASPRQNIRMLPRSGDRMTGEVVRSECAKRRRGAYPFQNRRSSDTWERQQQWRHRRPPLGNDSRGVRAMRRPS
jgi:hypothetical protein